MVTRVPEARAGDVRRVKRQDQVLRGGLRGAVDRQAVAQQAWGLPW